MSAVAGLLSIGNDTNQSLDSKGDLVGEYQETILVRNSKGMNAGSTLFGLMSRLKAEPAENTEFNWFERDPVNRQLYSNSANSATITAGATDTISLYQDAGATIDGWPFLAAGHVLRNTRSGEYIKVASTPSSSTGINIIRSINTSVTATVQTYRVQVGDLFTIITLGQDEGALPTRASYEEAAVLTNYVQTYNATVELANAFKANKLRSDMAGPLKARRVQALEKVSKDIEASFLLGIKNRLTGTNGYQYYTGGVTNAVDTGAPANALAGGGSGGVALSVFNAWLQGFMTVGSDAKLALCGPTAYSAISNFANSATNGFRIMNQETVFGMNITVINTPFGELDLAFHPLLREIPAYVDWMFVVDLAHIIQKTQEPLFLEPNIQTPGQDSYKEQFRAKLGLKLRFAEAFGYASSLQKITTS